MSDEAGQELTRVAVLGAGALGAFYASRLARVAGLEITLLAAGDRAARLRRDGLVVNGEPVRLPVRDPAEADRPVELLLVALKHQQLDEALPALARLSSPQTLILSVMNGLDSDAQLATACGSETTLYCIAVGIDAVREDGRITVANAGRLCFGEAENRQVSRPVRRVQRLLDRAGLAWETPADMLRTLWWKFMINVGVNQASAVLRAPYGVFQRGGDALAVSDILMREVLAVAAAEGIDLGETDLAAWRPILQALAPAGKTSMLQDIEAGRPTEVGMFAGKVIALGARHGIPTPANQLVLRLIRAMEAMAAG